MKLNILIKNKDGHEIDTDLYSITISSSKYSYFLLIFIHGFKGFKDWGGFPYMMNKLAEAGFSTAGFNFSFNGVDRKSSMDFTHLDLFAKNTLSRELDELGCVIDHFYSNADKYNFDKEKIFLIGHSRGGGISIIKAAEDKRIKALITLASVSDFDRYSAGHKKKWREQGYFEILNSRTNQIMRLNATLLEDIENNKERLNILSAAGKLNIPYLIVHGKEDLSVKFSEGEEIYKHTPNNLGEFLPVERTGHTFGVVHPFMGSTPAFDSVIDNMIGFLKRRF